MRVQALCGCWEGKGELMGVGSGRVVIFVSSFGWEFVCAVLDWIQLWENLLVCVREWVYGGGYFEDMIICVGVMRRCE